MAEEAVSIQRAIRVIARDALEQEAGGRLRSVLEYQTMATVGAGTVQRAFHMLEDSGAVVTRTRGYQGRFVLSRDLGRLWLLAGLPQARVVLTPPGAVEVYAMAEALFMEFAHIGIPLRIDYRRGAANRLHDVTQSFSAAVVSEGAVLAANDGHLRWRTMGEGTYYAPGSIVVLSNRHFELGRARTFRIGVDRESDDHVRLTNLEFPEGDHLYVECPFPDVPSEILRGNIDVGIWHRMLLLIPPDVVGLQARPLSPAGQKLVTYLSRAVIALSSEATVLANVIDALSFARIARVQRKLISAQLPQAIGSAWYR